MMWPYAAGEKVGNSSVCGMEDHKNELENEKKKAECSSL